MMPRAAEVAVLAPALAYWRVAGSERTGVMSERYRASAPWSVRSRTEGGACADAVGQCADLVDERYIAVTGERYRTEPALQAAYFQKQKYRSHLIPF